MGAWLVNVLKLAIDIIVPLGTSKIVGNIVANAVKNESTISKVCATVAGIGIDLAVSDVASDAAKKYVDKADEYITEHFVEER